MATSVTGTKDFFDSEVGYQINYRWVPWRLEQYSLYTSAVMPDVNDFVKKAVRVPENYGKALERGRKAAERIRSKFVWEKAAERLVEIIKGDGDGVN